MFDYLDDMYYQYRLDGFKANLVRFETKSLHWKCLNIIAFCIILLRQL